MEREERMKPEDGEEKNNGEEEEELEVARKMRGRGRTGTRR